MKVLWIINHYAQASGGIGSTRHADLANYMASFDWLVHVFASSVELNTQRQRLHQHEIYRSEAVGNVNFRWIKSPDYQGNGVGRMFNMFGFTLRLLNWRVTEGMEAPSVIIGSSVHPFAALSAAILARRYKVHFIFEVRDIWPESLIAMGYIHKYNPIAVMLAYLEAWLCKRASHIISVIPNYVDYLKERKMTAPGVTYIPNGVDMGMFSEVSLYKKEETFKLVYLGAHGVANSLFTLLDAMQIIEHGFKLTNIKCTLIGEGSMKKVLKKYAKEKNLRQVYFRDAIPKAEIGKLAIETDAFVICGRKLPSVYKYGISMNKLYDYMAMARPILMTMDSINNPVIEADAGISVPPESPQHLADAIVEMSNKTETELRDMGLNGRRYVEEHHNMKLLAERLAAILDNCLAARM